MQPWNACTSEPNLILKWIECHPGLAGYVQALGVVVTLLLAIAGPPVARAWGRHRAHVLRRRTTTNVILGSAPNVDLLLERINGRLATVDTYGDPFGADANLVFDNLGVEIPGSLDMIFADDEHFERARLEFLQRLTNDARGYNLMLAQMRQRGVPEGRWDSLRLQIRAKLEDLKWEVTGAQGIISREQRQG